MMNRRGLTITSSFVHVTKYSIYPLFRLNQYFYLLIFSAIQLYQLYLLFVFESLACLRSHKMFFNNLFNIVAKSISSIFNFHKKKASPIGLASQFKNKEFKKIEQQLRFQAYEA